MTAATYAAFGTDIKQDSHFLVRLADGLAVRAVESSNSLEGAYNFSSSSGLPNTLPFAQLVSTFR